MKFYTEGKAGKAIVYATPEGNFLSPKAVLNLLEAQKAKDAQIAKNTLNCNASGCDVPYIISQNILNQ